MFNKNFYPTPPEVIQRMIFQVSINDKIILEPQAGKGNIIDFLKGYSPKQIIACEINPELALIAANKADVFLQNDFLTVNSEQISHVDLIIMNPPFDHADKHILHAWEIAPEGCEIISLLNTETLSKRDRSISRAKLYSLIEKCGQREDLGNCFSISERKTDVEVSKIRLFKPVVSEEKEFEGYFDLEEGQTYQENGIMAFNDIVEVVGRYKQAVQLFSSVSDITKQIIDTMKPLGMDLNLSFHGSQESARSNIYREVTREEFKKKLQKEAWRSVFKRMKMDKYLTKSSFEKVNKFVETQTNIPFTVSNIYKMIDVIIQTYGQRMEEVIVNAFDDITKHTHKNRFQKEGWKTNSQYVVNSKFIINWGVINQENYGKIGSHWSDTSRMDDIHKAMKFATGKNPQITIKTTDENGLEKEELIDLPSWYDFMQNRQLVDGSLINTYREPNKWYDWGFFTIKGFKKGSLHVKFKSEQDRWAFNQMACKAKGFHLAEKYSSDFRTKETGIVIK